MVAEIACHVNAKRPGRLEPCALRRERHHTLSLRITRAPWKT